MALQLTDVLVLQRATGAEPLFKLSLSELTDYIQASDVLTLRGGRDFADSSVDPSTDGTGRATGDLYINTGTGQDVANGWADMTGTVRPGDRAVWDDDNTVWIVVRGNNTSAVVESVDVQAPITRDNTDPANPIIKSRVANTTRSGHVAKLAQASDVVTSNTTPSDTAVVTADLLHATNQEVEACVTSINSVNTIDVTGTVNVPVIEVKDLVFVDYVAGTGDAVLQWDGSTWVASTSIDGGEYS